MGSENYVHSKAQKFVASEWNIEVIRVAGISVERNIADSVETQNSLLWKKLDSTLKKDSKKQFRSDLINEMKSIISAEKIYKANKKAKRLRRKIENRKLDTYAELESKKYKNTYIYTVYSYKKNNSNNLKTAEFDVVVNTENCTSEIKKPNANTVYN